MASNSTERVLAIPELLEHVLSFLPIRNLLFAQLISKEVKNIINTSPNLQKLLFFTPRQPLPGEHADNTVMNPILREVFEPWFRNVSLLYKHEINSGRQLRRSSWAKSDGTLAAINRSEASWRNMLVTQPAIETLAIFSVMHLDRSQDRDTISRGEITFHDGLRMGALYDLTIEPILRNPKTRFGLRWHPFEIGNFYAPNWESSDQPYATLRRVTLLLSDAYVALDDCVEGNSVSSLKSNGHQPLEVMLTLQKQKVEHGFFKLMLR